MGATSADGAGGAAEEACSGNATGIAAESASATIGGAGAVGGGGGAKVATFSMAGVLFEAGAADSDGACALTAAPARRRFSGGASARASGYISRTKPRQFST